MNISTRPADSPFRESEWDRRLDNMLHDLESRTINTESCGGAAVASQQQMFTSQQAYSYTSSQQKEMKGQSNSSSSSYQRSAMVTQSTGKEGQGFRGGSSFPILKSPSSGSMHNSANEALHNLERGVLKSTNYIQESHKNVSSPEATMEWHMVKQGGDQPGEEFNLERQVQHMMPSAGRLQEKRDNFMAAGSSEKRSIASQQQQQQQHLTTYKVQSNQYTGASDRLTSLSPTWDNQDDDNRPGSRLKQNIDDLDHLLSDLNNARNLSPEGADYTTSSGGMVGLDSDDYSEMVGKQGHVRRTVNAFNEYSAQMAATDYSKKPPSPGPRRKANISPGTARKAASSPSWQQQSIMSTSSSSNMHQSSSSYRFQSNMDQQDYSQTSSDSYGGLAATRSTPARSIPHIQPSDIIQSPSPDLSQPSNYTKCHSSHSRNMIQADQDPPPVPFPTQTAPSPTPQSLPKQVDELMSEFNEFDTGGGSSFSNYQFMFNSTAKPAKSSSVVVTELPDEPPPARINPAVPAPIIHHPSPPRLKTESRKGPEVYYPSGADFAGGSSRVADQPDITLDKGERRVRARDLERGKVHNRGVDTGNKQGAAVIPICLPLCCATPCAIL